MQMVSRSRVGLVVDDNPIVARRACDLLNEQGVATPDYATTSEETYDLARRLHPDVFLVDIRLKDEDGVELAKQLWRDFGVRAIFLTAFSEDAKTRTRAEAAHPIAILGKPLTQEALANALTRLARSEVPYQVDLGQFATLYRGLVGCGRQDAKQALFRIMSLVLKSPSTCGIRMDDQRCASTGPISVTYEVCEESRVVKVTGLDCAPYEPPFHGDLPRLK